MIKKLLIALVVVVVLVIGAVAAASFIAPTDYRVERETTINKPASEIYSYAKLLKNQNEWGPWFKREPTMQQQFRGTDGEVGFVVQWKGDKAETGEGEQEIKRLVPGKQIDTQLRFKEPMASTSDAYLILEPAGDNQTKVKWGFSGSMPRPMNAIMLMMDMDQAVGKDFAEGLASLKTIMESK
jgi:hypothetical protein